MAHGTFKPCPGCGGDRYRAPKSVCNDCKELLLLGLAVKEGAAPKDEPHLYRLTAEWPGIYWPSDGDSEEGLHKKLNAAFLALAQAALKRAKTRIKPYDEKVIALPSKDQANYFSTYDEGASVWAGSQRLAKAIEKLDLHVREAVMDAYEAGERSGQNLLKQIAGGHVTIAELNEAHIESGRGKRK